MVAGDGQLDLPALLVGVKEPQIEHAVDHQHATRLLAGRALAARLGVPFLDSDAEIETALTEAGYHLSSRLLYKLKRALHYYTEETERANNGCPRGDSNCTQRIFISHYGRHAHGCRDHRPDHWRKYL